jgi:hypothetical protein
MYGEVEDLGFDEKIILKRIFNKLDEDVDCALLCLITWTCDELL